MGIKYPYDLTQLKCTLRNYTGNKYNRLQVHGRVNSKHPDRNSEIDIFTDSMAKLVFARDKTRNDIDTHQSLLDLELKYERVCIVYHYDLGNIDIWGNNT